MSIFIRGAIESRKRRTQFSFEFLSALDSYAKQHGLGEFVPPKIVFDNGWYAIGPHDYHLKYRESELIAETINLNSGQISPRLLERLKIGFAVSFPIASL